MPHSMPNTKTFVVAYLLWCLAVWLLLLPATFQSFQRRARTSAQRLALLSMAALCSLLLLSACGTAPSRAPTHQQVPAALLVPPKAPTLLVPKTPVSPSTTPGPTTRPTQKAAQPTGSGTST